MSGLKVNYSKSMLCGIAVQEQEVNQMANILGCQSGKLPMKYLGLPLGADPSRIATWNPVVDNVKKKLKLWKQRYGRKACSSQIHFK